MHRLPVALLLALSLGVSACGDDPAPADSGRVGEATRSFTTACAGQAAEAATALSVVESSWNETDAMLLVCDGVAHASAFGDDTAPRAERFAEQANEVCDTEDGISGLVALSVVESSWNETDALIVHCRSGLTKTISR